MTQSIQQKTRNENLLNQLWLILNNKETDFEDFCKVNDLNKNNPVSLQFFINQQKR